MKRWWQGKKSGRVGDGTHEQAPCAENRVSISRSRRERCEPTSKQRERYNRVEFIATDPLCVAYEWPEGPSERWPASSLLVIQRRREQYCRVIPRLLSLLTLDGRLSVSESIEDSSISEIKSGSMISNIGGWIA